MSENSNTEHFKIIAKYLFWLIVFGTIIYLFQDRTKTLKIGGLELEIEEQANKIGEDEIVPLIQKMSNEAIKLLIEIGQEDIRIIDYSHRDDGSLRDFSINSNYRFYEELQNFNFIDVSERLPELRKYFMSKEPNSENVYKCLYGKYVYEAKYGCDEKVTVYSLRAKRLTENEINRFMNVSVKRTTKGVNAYHILINAMVSQLEK